MTGAFEPKERASQRARVVSVSRRVVELLDGEQVITARTSSKAIDVIVGDFVRYTNDGAEAVVLSQQERRNLLAKSIGKRRHDLLANLDRLFIVAAAPPLFNTTFVDRVLTVAGVAGIPCSLLANKIDLGLDDLSYYTEIYQEIGVPLILTSAKTGEGLDELHHCLAQPGLELVAFIGVSGVGKSTLLNRLIPGLEIRTGEVSEKTGQGKQTTTQPIAHRYLSPVGKVLIVDMPGVQNFGVAHLTKEQLYGAFVEIAERYGQCQFDNCSHIYEDECAVKQALEDGAIAESRYLSFIEMVSEVESLREFERDS